MIILQGLAGIPEFGIRLTLLVVVTFMLAVMAALVYFKMKEKDKGGS